jgi:hypothetical protein
VAEDPTLPDTAHPAPSLDAELAELRDQVAKLRTKNARLLRLLELTPSEARPPLPRPAARTMTGSTRNLTRALHDARCLTSATSRVGSHRVRAPEWLWRLQASAGMAVSDQVIVGGSLPQSARNPRNKGLQQSAAPGAASKW